MIQNRIEILSQIPEMIDFLIHIPDYDLSIFEHKKMKTTIETSKNILKRRTSYFLEIQNDYSIENLNSLINNYIKR